MIGYAPEGTFNRKEQLVWRELRRFGAANRGRECRPSQETIAKRAGVSTTTVKRTIRKARDMGLLTVRRISRLAANIYRFVDGPKRDRQYFRKRKHGARQAVSVTAAAFAAIQLPPSIAVDGIPRGELVALLRQVNPNHSPADIQRAADLVLARAA